jgi:Condensation domain
VVLSDQLLVDFRGEGAGAGDLSWGQKGMWQTIEREGQSVTMSGITPLAPGTTLQDLVQVLRFSVSRHQSLRTRLCFGPQATVQQVVSESGVIALNVVDAAGDADPYEVALAVQHDYQNRDFDYVNEWPLRMAVIRSGAVLSHAVVVYLHLSIDAMGLQALLADLARMDPTTGTAITPVTAMQPLEQARWQHSAAAQRQCEASLRHLEQVLRTVAIHRLPGPLTDGEPNYLNLSFRSPATRLAVRLIADRLRIDTSPILLGLFGIAVARLTGSNPFVTMLTVSNRFRPGLADSVSVVAQLSPCMLELADVSLDEALRRARRATVSAYKYAYYDPAQRLALIEQVGRDRGEKVDLSCFFNDRRTNRDLGAAVPSPQDVLAAVGLGEHRWQTEVEEVIPEKLYLSVDDVDDAVVFILSADDRYLPAAQMQALLSGIEAVAVQAALDPAASTRVRPVEVAV